MNDFVTPNSSSGLAGVVKDELARYFQHLADRVERAVRSLPKDKLWVKPFEFGNSVGHLVLHLTGNLSHYIGAAFASTGYVRDRAAEFTDRKQESPDIVLQRFQEVMRLVIATLRAQSDMELTQSVPNEDPAQTRFGMFLVCAAHMNNHIGQMAYLVRAQGHSTNEPPMW